MGRRKGGIPGVSFSWKRAVGLSSAKGKLSRHIGIPLTRSGRQRKFGTAAGCSVALLVTGGLVVGSGHAAFVVSRLFL